ncbi:MAG: LysR family transcriptional regulator [Frankiales bacterium]|nr:LysR family transcriptional regulator [Frankiales bacterium]
MDARRLRAFVAVAEGLSISLAAQRLGYAQSSLSAQLRALEAELGSQLFLRTSTGVELTVVGRAVLPYARRSLDLDAEIHQIASGARPVTRIGALPTLVDHWLPELLVALAHDEQARSRQLDDFGEAPAKMSEISVVTGSRAQLTTQLAGAQLDLVFVFDNGVPTTGQHLVVAQDEVVVVSGPHHALAERDSVGLTELLDWEFLVAEAGCTSQMLVDRLGRDIGLLSPTAMVTGSMAALRHIASNGRGLALLPRLSVEDDLRSGALVELAIREPLPSIGIEARWAEDLGASAGTVRVLLEFARRAAPGLAQTA